MSYPAPNWAAIYAPPPPPDPQIAAMRSAAQQQRDLQEEIQKITMESNISAMRHGAMMTVIGNMK